MSEDGVTNLKWSSKAEFYVSLIGYSIGMPEFWRVPFLVYRNGGGTFVAAYILLMVVCGIPVYFLEIALSQFSGKGPWKIWDIFPLLRGIGISIAVLNAIYSVNTAIMEAWSFEYFVNSFRSVLPWATCDNSWNTEACFTDSTQSNTTHSALTNTTNSSVQNTFVQVHNTTQGAISPVDAVDEFWLYRVLRISGGIDQFGTISGIYILYLFVMRLVAGISMVRSVQSVGKLLMVTALLPVVLVVIIWIRALTLPGSLKGMKAFITPDWSRFGDPQLWIEASFQTFITLGPGWGGLLMFGCHNHFHTNNLRASVVGAVSTLAFGLLNGLVVFSVLGVMSEELSAPLHSVMTAGGFSISFIAYPKALSYFPFPQIWCAVFFIIMLLPGLDALAIYTEPFLLVVEEIFPCVFARKRIQLLVAVSLIAFIFGIPYASQSGVYIFLLVDWYTGTWSVMLICLAEILVFCWIYGGHRIDRDIKLMLGRGLPAVIRISSAFIMPIYTLALLIISSLTYTPPTLGKYSFPGYATGIGWCFTSLTVLPAVIYILWIVKKTKGSLQERIKCLTKRNNDWYPADERVVAIFNETEKLAGKSFTDVFMFNLLGRGRLDVESNAKDKHNDISLETQRGRLDVESIGIDNHNDISLEAQRGRLDVESIGVDNHNDISLEAQRGRLDVESIGKDKHNDISLETQRGRLNVESISKDKHNDISLEAQRGRLNAESIGKDKHNNISLQTQRERLDVESISKDKHNNIFLEAQRGKPNVESSGIANHDDISFSLERHVVEDCRL